MASEQEVVDRIRSFPERLLDLPTEDVVREGRRRRWTQRAWITLAVVAVAAGAAISPNVRGGTTVAGFTVFRADGREVIGLRVPSTSMQPTLRPGDLAAVDVRAYDDGRVPARGDVVVFTDATDAACDVIFLKRVVGVAGDTVEQRDGAIVVNGVPVDGLRRDRTTDTLGPWTVDPGRLFVVGDNLANSNDSRYSLGQVPVEDVVGRVDLSIVLHGADVPAPPGCVVAAARQ